MHTSLPVRWNQQRHEQDEQPGRRRDAGRASRAGLTREGRRAVDRVEHGRVILVDVVDSRVLVEDLLLRCRQAARRHLADGIMKHAVGEDERAHAPLAHLGRVDRGLRAFHHRRHRLRRLPLHRVSGIRVGQVISVVQVQRTGATGRLPAQNDLGRVDVVRRRVVL